ncbi:MAG: MerR family transcriptional regulator [Alphaproteobacteria bacterium]|jgi:DNA-binding transcriptional MerR regulator|nr:MerR family transcriptional regulator [Alphaproteobacteria bacterium]
MENKEYFSSINDVSKRLGIPAHTLRYWEKQFPSAVKPTTGAGGRRYYRAETVDTLVMIKDLLYAHGMTIAGVKKMLRNGDLNSETGAVVMPSGDTITVGGIEESNIDNAIRLLESARALLQ